MIKLWAGYRLTVDLDVAQTKSIPSYFVADMPPHVQWRSWDTMQEIIVARLERYG